MGSEFSAIFVEPVFVIAISICLGYAAYDAGKDPESKTAEWLAISAIVLLVMLISLDMILGIVFL